MKVSNNKKIVFMFVLLTFVSSVVAESTIVDFLDKDISMQDYTYLVPLANSYEVTKHIANKYDSIAINVTDDDYRVILIFENGELKEIKESQEVSDLEFKITKYDIIYLMENYKSMTAFDKVKFLIQHDVPIRDIITFSGIAMGMRG